MEGAPNFLRLNVDHDKTLNKWLSRTIQIPMVFEVKTISKPANAFKFRLDEDVTLLAIGTATLKN